MKVKLNDGGHCPPYITGAVRNRETLATPTRCRPLTGGGDKALPLGG